MATNLNKLSAQQSYIVSKIVEVGRVMGRTSADIGVAILFANAESTFDTKAFAGVTKNSARGLFQYQSESWITSTKDFNLKFNQPITGDVNNTLGVDSCVEQIKVFFNDLERYKNEWGSGNVTSKSSYEAALSEITSAGITLSQDEKFMLYLYQRHNRAPDGKQAFSVFTQKDNILNNKAAALNLSGNDSAPSVTEMMFGTKLVAYPGAAFISVARNNFTFYVEPETSVRETGNGGFFLERINGRVEVYQDGAIRPWFQGELKGSASH